MFSQPGELRVSLPRVQLGRGPRGGGVHHGRRGSWTVPLPVALGLLAALAVLFQWQLMQFMGAADSLEKQLQECRSQGGASASAFNSLRQSNAALQTQANAYRALLTAEQRASVAPMRLAAGGGSGAVTRSFAQGQQLDGPDEEPWVEVEEASPGGATRAGGAPKHEEAARREAEAMQELTPLPESALSSARAAAAAAASGGAVEVAAVLLVGYNRVEYLRRALGSVLRVHSGDPRFPFTVSLDGTHAPTLAMARQFAATHKLNVWQHSQNAKPLLQKRSDNPAYYHIAEHYRWALEKLFMEQGHQRVIILEDDMEVAPDFFEYFAAMAPVLDSDETLWCVSSWNDNGQGAHVGDSTAVYRTDFFPGLGWMLHRRTWLQLRATWPGAYWDDWMRGDRVRQGRQCVRPDVCRTYNFGKSGASKGQFFSQYLAPVRLNTAWVPWTRQDLSFLAQPDAYARYFSSQVVAAQLVASVEEALASAHGDDVALSYDCRAAFMRNAAQLGIMKEWKEGLPRASYQGVVTLSLHGGAGRLFLVPLEWLGKARAESIREARAQRALADGSEGREEEGSLTTSR